MIAFPKFVLGVNYWSRAGGPRMWERFDAATVQQELSRMREIGIEACRMFAFIPTFMPNPPSLVPEPLERLAEFAKLAEAAGVGLYPTPLVGHMSGDNFDFAGHGERSLYADAELVAWQRALVTAVVDALRPSLAVRGWILTNEMHLWARAHLGVKPRIEDVVAWCKTLVDCVRARDPRPIGTGDGQLRGGGSHALDPIAPLVDWVAPHVYGGDADPMRQAYAIDFAVRSALPLGREVLLEEFGCSSTQAGEAEQAAYHREAIFAALGGGARGAFSWCLTDFDAETLGREDPYEHQAFELGFGLLRKDGSPKPVCDEWRAARALLDAQPIGTLAIAPPRVAIMRPRYLDQDEPFSWQDREAMRRTLLQSFVLASQAGLDPVVVSEHDDLASYALILAPSVQKLGTPAWLALREAARRGATVYWSWFSGDHSFHQGSWCPIFEELTGCKHTLRYGCFDLPGERFTLRGAAPLSVPTGVLHSSAPHALSRLPIVPMAEAPVRLIANDGEGRAALVANTIGSGRVIFLASPIERYLANLPDGSARDVHRLYRLLGEEAGVQPTYPTHHPDVQSRVLSSPEAELVIVQHRGWAERVDDATEVPRDSEIVFDRSGRSDGAFGPKGVRVYRVR
jgi:endo-1,4-beta-mannosidase